MSDCVVIKGPALVYGGALTGIPSMGTRAIRTRGDVTIRSEVTVTENAVDSVGVASRHVDLSRVVVEFEPSGTVGDAEVLLTRFAQTNTEPQPGQLLHAWRALTISVTADGGSGRTLVTVPSTLGLVVGQYVTITAHSQAALVGTWRIVALTSTVITLATSSFAGTGTGTLRHHDALCIHPLYAGAGDVVVVQNAAVTGLPGLRLAANVPASVGGVTLTGVVHRGLGPDKVDALVGYETWENPPAGSLLSQYNPASQLIGSVRARFGEASAEAFGEDDPLTGPWRDFGTREGWTVSFDLRVTDEVVDRCGLVGVTFQDLNVTASAEPVGSALTAEVVGALLRQQRQGSVLGRPRGASMAEDPALELRLLIGEAVQLAVHSAAPRQAVQRYGVQNPRNGALDFVGLRRFVGGVRQALFSLET